MCNIYVGASRASYGSTSRSIRIHGAVTSIRLKNEFRDIPEEMACSEDTAVPRFINTLYNELMENQ